MTLGDHTWKHLQALRQLVARNAELERPAGPSFTGEEGLRFALAAAPVVLWTTDLDGTITLSEGRGLAALERDLGSLVGRHVAEAFAHAPGVVANVRRTLAGETFEASVTVGERVFRASYAPLRGARGEQVGSLGVGYDVTDLVRAEHAARQAREQAEALLELSRVLEMETGAEPAWVARAALAAIGRVLEDGWLALWQREGDRFLPLALHGEVPSRVREGQLRGLPGEDGLGTGQAVFLTAGTPVGDGVGAGWPHGLRGAALLPLAPTHPGQELVLGVYRTGPFERWLPFERELLAAAARTLAAGFGRWRHLRMLEAAARTDTLTGLGNRRAFELDLGAELGHARRAGDTFGVLSIDLDGLKRVNDNRGHARGDALLREFARALRGSFRREDRVYRLSGDEYVVLLPGVGPAEVALILGRVEAAVGLTRAVGFPEMDASAGLACCPADAWDAAELVRLSDRRMYEVKAAKRARREALPCLPGPLAPRRARAAFPRF